jgi:hypothetical protein
MSVTLTSGERRSVVDILNDVMGGLALERPQGRVAAAVQEELLSALERAASRGVRYENEIERDRAQSEDDSDGGSVNNDGHFNPRNPPRPPVQVRTRITFCGKHCKAQREPARPGELGTGEWRSVSIASDWRASTNSQQCSAIQKKNRRHCTNKAKYLVQVPASEI